MSLSRQTSDASDKSNEAYTYEDSDGEDAYQYQSDDEVEADSSTSWGGSTKGLADAQADVDEINDLNRRGGGVGLVGVAAGMFGSAQLYIWLSIAPYRSLLDDERCRAWGLDPAKHICLRVDFDSYYTESSTHPNISVVCQSSTHLHSQRAEPWEREVYATDRLNVKELEKDSTSAFSLSWMLQDRVNKNFLKLAQHWPPADLCRGGGSAQGSSAADKCSAQQAQFLNNVRETFGSVEEDGVADEVALLAYEKSHRDESDAIMLLMDSERRAAMEAELTTPQSVIGLSFSASSGSSGASADTIDLTGDGSSTAPFAFAAQSAELSSFFPGAAPALLRRALVLTAGDLSAAGELLTADPSGESVLAEAAARVAVAAGGVDTGGSGIGSGGGSGSGSGGSGRSRSRGKGKANRDRDMDVDADCGGEGDEELEELEPPKLKRQRSGAETAMIVAQQARDDELPFSRGNFLVRVLHQVEDTLRRANQHCLVCDKHVQGQWCKPVVCQKPTCLFSYEQFGLGLNVAAEVLAQPDVVDLLITFLVASVHGGRVEVCYPQEVEVHSQDGFAHGFMYHNAPSRLKKSKGNKAGSVCPSIPMPPPTAPHGTQPAGAAAGVGAGAGEGYNIGELATVAGLIPPVRVLQQWAHSGCLVAQLDAIHPLLYPLLRWVLSSNRSHLRKLEEHEKIKDVGTDDQYMLVTGPVERESTFQALKARYGSLHVFHGSAIGNWHAILRTSLRNMSHSKYMSAGAAYGSGIYFAESQAMSLGYCQVTFGGGVRLRGWEHSRFYREAGTNCMALCEVVDNKPKFTHSSNGIFVVPQEEYVVTRYFLVNPGGQAQASKLKVPASGGGSSS